MEKIHEWKSARMRRKHCSLAVVRHSQKFCLPQTPFSRMRDDQNLINWRWSLPLPTNPVWWGSMHAISSYHGNRPTNTHTHTHKQTGPITIHCTTASAQCKLCNNRNTTGKYTPILSVSMPVLTIWQESGANDLHISELRLSTMSPTIISCFSKVQNGWTTITDLLRLFWDTVLTKWMQQ